jgi:transposase-like protein
MNKRRKYTREFKEEAVKLISEQGYQVAEAARIRELKRAGGPETIIAAINPERQR